MKFGIFSGDVCVGTFKTLPKLLAALKWVQLGNQDVIRLDDGIRVYAWGRLIPAGQFVAQHATKKPLLRQSRMEESVDLSKVW